MGHSTGSQPLQVKVKTRAPHEGGSLILDRDSSFIICQERFFGPENNSFYLSVLRTLECVEKTYKGRL